MEALTYHVLAYQHAYRYSIFIHYITKKLEDLAHTFSSIFKNYEIDEFFVGVETLEVEAGSGLFVFKCEDYETKFIESRGEVNEEELVEKKSKRLTLDYDFGDVHNFVINYYENKPDTVEEFFYETKRGAHLRAKLTKSLTFKEKIEIRKKLHDDPNRVIYDLALHDEGFEFLTDLLFNEKYHFKDELSLLYNEKPLLIKEFTVPISLPNMRIREFEIKTEFKRPEIILSRPVKPEKFYKVYKKVIEKANESASDVITFLAKNLI